MRAFSYSRPNTLDDALSALGPASDQESVQLIAGGTDLLTLMKHDIVKPRQLVDLKRLTELSDRIEVGDDRIELGCLTKLSAIETHHELRTHCTALVEAAAIAATPQLRNMATIAGNLLQRPRCWYFRHPDIDCWLKGGQACPAREGENSHHSLFATGDSPCVAVHPSDPAAALMALNAAVRVRGTGGDREISLRDLYALPDETRRRETILASDDVIVSITIPRPEPNTRSTYLKAMDRKAWAFALVGVAASVRVDSGRIEEANLVLSGVAPVPWVVSDLANSLVGRNPSAALYADIAEQIMRSAVPLSKNGYKVQIAKTLIRRALVNVSGVWGDG